MVIFLFLHQPELDLYFSADKEIPTLVPHKCEVKYCLLNLMETYKGTREQIKAIEYLERKFNQWDPSGEVLRRFYRYWSEKPKGLGSPPHRGGSALKDLQGTNPHIPAVPHSKEIL